MDLGTAFFLGFLGSLHCAGMCGPLALALPGIDRGPLAFLFGRLACNAGRLLTYALLGLVFGLVGKSFALAGLQQGIAIVAGAAIVIASLTARKVPWSLPVYTSVPWLKRQLGARMKSGTFSSLAVLGLFNGLLPCGLVYVACAGAVATGGLISAVTFMIVFGAGTVPMMLGISVIGRNLQTSIRLRFQQLIPAGLVVVGLLLILRGMALGIPILSPDIAHGDSVSYHP